MTGYLNGMEAHRLPLARAHCGVAHGDDRITPRYPEGPEQAGPTVNDAACDTVGRGSRWGVR